MELLDKQSHTLDERKELQERAMDSNDLEKERGITILAKNTAVAYTVSSHQYYGYARGTRTSAEKLSGLAKMVGGVVLVVDA